MTTNTHIMTINDRITAAVHLVRSLPDSPEKQILLSLLTDAIDHLMEVNRELGNHMEREKVLQERLEQYQRAMYEPMVSAQYTYPKEGVYNDVREYVKQRKARDEVFRDYCQTHTRKELCELLSIEFGWIVDPGSYGQNLRRN